MPPTYRKTVSSSEERYSKHAKRDHCNDNRKRAVLKHYMWLIQDGRWADHSCEKAYGYICKSKASTKPAEGAQAEANPGCKLVSAVFSF